MQSNSNSNHNNVYSQLLDFLKFYGEDLFFGDHSVDLKRDWDIETRHIDNVEADIVSGLDELQRKTDNSLKILSSAQCLSLNIEQIKNNEYIFFSLEEDWEIIPPDDSSELNILFEINRAFNTLDDLVYLNESIRDFAEKNFWTFLKNDILKQKISDVVEKLLDSVLLEGPHSYLRLIPLNPIRQQRLENIPLSEIYLFPWYSEFVDLPEETLLILAEELAGTSTLIKTSISETDLKWLMQEVQIDHELHKALQEKAEIFRLLPKALDQAYSFRWLTAADNTAGSFRVSKQVSESGLVDAAIRVTVNTILSKASASEWKFRAGFCGTGLGDDQRLQLLKPIETAIKEKPDFKWEGSFHLIGQWINKWISENNARKFSDDNLAETLFNGWVADLNAVAEKGYKQLFFEKDIYWRLLTTDNPHPLAKAIQDFDLGKIDAGTLLINYIAYEPDDELDWEKILPAYVKTIPEGKIFTPGENPHDFSTGTLPEFMSYKEPFQAYEKEFCDSSEDGTYTTVGFFVWTRNNKEYKRLTVDIHVYYQEHQDGKLTVSGKVVFPLLQKMADKIEKKFEWQTDTQAISPLLLECDFQTGWFTAEFETAEFETAEFKTGKDIPGRMAAWFIINT